MDGDQKLERREVLRALSAAPAAALAWTGGEAQARTTEPAQAATQPVAAGQGYKPSFFTSEEYATLSALVQLIIPPDARSPGAIEAGVPQFIDFLMIDQPKRQVAMRGGLRWIDNECRDRFGKTFLEADGSQQTAVLDDIALPSDARPELAHGMKFFSTLRDLTATGFFTSREGIADLGYQGNVFVDAWNGPPKEALDHLGVSYARIEHWYKEK